MDNTKYFVQFSDGSMMMFDNPAEYYLFVGGDNRGGKSSLLSSFCAGLLSCLIFGVILLIVFSIN